MISLEFIVIRNIEIIEAILAVCIMQLCQKAQVIPALPGQRITAHLTLADPNGKKTLIRYRSVASSRQTPVSEAAERRLTRRRAAEVAELAGRG